MTKQVGAPTPPASGLAKRSGLAELSAAMLYRRCDPALFDFETTEELEDPPGTVGQPRAIAAVEFGTEIDGEGYNIFVHGAAGTGKEAAVRRFLEWRARRRPAPDDFCYVNNFDEPRRVRLLRLPAGRGAELRREMEQLVDELATALGAAFESEEYQNRQSAIKAALEERQEEAFNELGEEASKKSLALMRTPVGIVFAPVRDGEVIGPDDFEKLTPKERERLQAESTNFEKKLQGIFRQLPGWKREAREKLRQLNRQVSRFAIGPLFDEVREKFEGLDDVIDYLDAVRADVLANSRALVNGKDDPEQRALKAIARGETAEGAYTRRFSVNVLVDYSESEGAPVVFEDNPTFQNLVGRIEHLQQMGALVTDFSLIQPGALHRANGGYLILDALKLLQQPYAWEGLKRALTGKRIKCESLGEALSLVSIYSLDPEPVPLAVKVVLVGEPHIYYLLSGLDPEFSKLFKVAADFGEACGRAPDSERLYARQIARLCREEKLAAFDRSAVARLIEHAARSSGDAERLSLRLGPMRDLMREASHWAARKSAGTVQAAHVQEAIDAAEYRADRLRERLAEETLRGTYLVATDGEAVGQVNGLAVYSLAGFDFGRPSRITARVRLGKGEVIDIEREVELAGPIHSKGVLILSGFLGSRYATERPLSLAASLVFEQSYSGVEGDSASSAELYALLSAISRIPLKQSLAVTGSVNQMGQVQAIGGANQKIEGFFDLCAARGLTGEQGVLIPASNVHHLMLAERVVKAVEAGRFHVHPVETVDQGISILTGIEASERDADGAFPEGSVNQRVEERLVELAEAVRSFVHPPSAKEEALEG